MSKPRSPESLLTKLEDMKVGDQIFVKKTNGYISDVANTVCKNFPGRKYTQITLYTHEKLEFTSLKDFSKIICVTRVS